MQTLQKRKHPKHTPQIPESTSTIAVPSTSFDKFTRSACCRNLIYWRMFAVTDLGHWPVAIGGPLVIALALLLMRVFVMGRAQEKRQRANRQQTERLKSLVSAYRALAGSFRPITHGEHIEPADRSAIESALSDILLFGSAAQVEMAANCARAFVNGDHPPLAPLITDLRRDLRAQLGLAPLDAALQLPEPGPLRGARNDRKDSNGAPSTNGARSGGGGAGGGMLMGGSLSATLQSDDNRP